MAVSVMSRRALLPLLVLAATWVAGGANARGQDASPVQRRAALLKAAARGEDSIPRIAAALDDENAVVRRTAARLLAAMGKPASSALAQGLEDADFLVRRTCLVALCEAGGEASVPLLEKALRDDHVAVRLMALQELVSMTPRTERVDKLLHAACADGDDTVRAIAARATWAFQRENVSLREREDYDHDVTVIQTLPLPKDDWRFKLDPQRDGHTRTWFEPAFDDSGWDTIAIEQAWQKAGYEYIGVTWYRRTIELPAKPEHTAVDIHFKGVDECAWVWLNGVYIGQHDMGPEGWNKPFTLDITKEVRWGQPNQITVRAMNTAHAGGIWCPVQIEVLK